MENRKYYLEFKSKSFAFAIIFSILGLLICSLEMKNTFSFEFLLNDNIRRIIFTNPYFISELLAILFYIVTVITLFIAKKNAKIFILPFLINVIFSFYSKQIDNYLFNQYCNRFMYGYVQTAISIVLLVIFLLTIFNKIKNTNTLIICSILFAVITFFYLYLHIHFFSILIQVNYMVSSNLIIQKIFLYLAFGCVAKSIRVTEEEQVEFNTPSTPNSRDGKRLNNLQHLKDSGFYTDEEYNKKKDKIEKRLQ